MISKKLIPLFSPLEMSFSHTGINQEVKP